MRLIFAKKVPNRLGLKIYEAPDWFLCAPERLALTPSRPHCVPASRTKGFDSPVSPTIFRTLQKDLHNSSHIVKMAALTTSSVTAVRAVKGARATFGSRAAFAAPARATVSSRASLKVQAANRELW